MTEELLQYIWRYQRFKNSLTTVEGNDIEIISAGNYNTNAGPDFLEAKIKIGNTQWAGNIEVHIKSSDWYLHKHQNDKAYNNIILHVVFEHDINVPDVNGNNIETVEIKNYLDEELIEKYQDFIKNKNWIPCSGMIKNVDDFIINNWLENLSIERLQYKVEDLIKKLNHYNNNWEQVFYETIARNFGFNLYADAFEMLAKSLPLACIAKHKNKLFQIEAMLFGQAGFLDENFADEYPNNLKSEYLYLKNKFKLSPIEKHLWKFLRNRPNNFPTIRIAQFASLLHLSSHLFSKIIGSKSVFELQSLFNLNCSEYWENHYTFDILSTVKSKKAGKGTINLLLINTVIPFIFAFGKIKDDETYIERALSFLDKLAAERNFITNNFNLLGVIAQNARQSQALNQLFKYYCTKKHCLRCSIGDHILNTERQK